MSAQRYIYLLVGVVALSSMLCSAQDYDDDGYGNQGGNNNQGDGDNYGNNDDGYSNNAPNYQQNIDSDGSNSNPNQYSPQGGNDADGDYEGDDGTAAAASSISPTFVRVRRSVEAPKVATEPIKTSGSEAKLRVKRHGKHYIGPVYTYVKTDKHANFKWGVKHKVGKKHHG